MRSDDGKVITASYEEDGKRIMVDGGFTRLMPNRWDRTAGTARFVIADKVGRQGQPIVAELFRPGEGGF